MLHVTGHFWHVFPFLLSPRTGNRTWSGGSTHCHDNRGKFVSVEMDDVAHKPECLKVKKMTTVLTAWRLDKQQQGKVNREGRNRQCCIWETSEWQVFNFGVKKKKKQSLKGKVKCKVSHFKEGPVRISILLRGNPILPQAELEHIKSVYPALQLQLLKCCVCYLAIYGD